MQAWNGSLSSVQNAGASDRGRREQADRALFDRIASNYARKDVAPSSRVARKYRLTSTLDTVPNDHPLHILEVGCGAGYAIDYLNDPVGRYLGVDHSTELIEHARSRHQDSAVEFRSMRIHDLAETDAFDVVFVIGVLHHLDDVDGALERMVAALRPGGTLAVNEPQPGNPVVRVARRVRKRVDRSYSEDQIEFTPAELREMFVRHGLREVGTRPQGFLSTPFAEVPLPLPAVTVRLARLAVAADRRIARWGTPSRFAWNCIATGRK
jgi:2-polyprenyl-3-methyl-5-hydroxy-6-metoxy-1,4-benzoquinol methylase